MAFNRVKYIMLSRYSRPLTKQIIFCTLGTVFEWYDFSLFIYLTPIISKLFFSHQQPLYLTPNQKNLLIADEHTSKLLVTRESERP